MSSSPIGVFDSGLGGLTVLEALRRALPAESFVYLGDVARLPYGTKSPAVIQRYSRKCVDFLLENGVKAVVVACNTATATALPLLKAEYKIPLYGVIEPGVQAAIDMTESKKVLVLGTESTVRSEAYLKTFRELGPDIEVQQLACPLFVPLVEEGWFDHHVTLETAKEYLRRVRDFDFDTVVLGCTHYPLLETAIRDALAARGKRIQLVHGAGRLAERLASELECARLPRTGELGTLRFVCTDSVSRQLPIVRSLFGNADFSVVDL